MSVRFYVKELGSRVEPRILKRGELKQINNIVLHSEDTISTLEEQYKCLVVFSLWKNTVSLLNKLILVPSDNERKEIVNILYEKLTTLYPDVEVNLSQKVKTQKTNNIKKHIKNNKYSNKYILSELKKKIVGQENALTVISDTISRAFVGLKDEDKPKACFFLAGPTGSGKTYAAEVLAEILYGKNWKEHLIVINGAELQCKGDSTKLLGAAPSYVGHETTVEFIAKLKKNPDAIILFDECEKAHYQIIDLFLNILDKGKFQDNIGKDIDCSNTFIIFTSNIGTETILKESIGFTPVDKTENKVLNKDIKTALRKRLRAELISRFDEIIIFNTLTYEEVYKITEIQRDKLVNRLLNKLDIQLEISEKVMEAITKEGFSKYFGARELKHVFSRQIENKIASYLSNSKEFPDNLFVDMVGGEIVVRKTKTESRNNSR